MASATPAVQHILDNIESCDSFFMAQQGVIDAASMAQSQQSLCMSVQLQLQNVSLLSPFEATEVTTRVQNSMFPDDMKQRIAAVVASRVGHLVAPASRVQTLNGALRYPACFALTAAASVHTCIHVFIYSYTYIHLHAHVRSYRT